jgi:hypothetical protein
VGQDQEEQLILPLLSQMRAWIDTALRCATLRILWSRTAVGPEPPRANRENSCPILYLGISPEFCDAAVVPKTLTREQLQSRKDQAVRFTQNVLQDPARADETADESLEDYAERRKIQITNSGRRRNGRRVWPIYAMIAFEDPHVTTRASLPFRPRGGPDVLQWRIRILLPHKQLATCQPAFFRPPGCRSSRWR